MKTSFTNPAEVKLRRTPAPPIDRFDPIAVLRRLKQMRIARSCGSAGLIIALLTSLAPARTEDAPPWTYTAQMLEALDEEIRHFADIERGASRAPRLVIRASLNYRVLAAELISQRNTGAPDAPVAALAGLTLAHGRASVDQLLIDLLQQGDGGHPDAALDHLRAFNDAVAGHARAVTSPDPAQGRAALARILRPLADLADLRMAGRPVPLPPIGLGNAAGDLAAAIDRLDAELAALPLPDRSRPVIASLIDFLRRGERFADLRLRVQLQLAHLRKLRAFADAVASAAWIGDEPRAAYIQQVHHAATLYLRPDTRAQAVELLDRLERCRAVISALTQLRERGVSVEAITTAFLAADAARLSPQDQSPAADALDILEPALGRMLTLAELASREFPPEVRAAAARLLRAARAAQIKAIARLPAIIDDPRAAAPAALGILADFSRAVDDLALLAEAPRWIDAFARTTASTRSACFKRLRTASQALAESRRRRDDARRTLRQLDDDVRRFHPLPFQHALQRAATPAVVLTAGRQRHLLDRVSATPEEWAAAWSRNQITDGLRDRLDILHQLTATMADCAGLVDLADDPGRLNRCPGLELSAPLLSRLVSDTISRLKLATIAVLADQHDDAASQLEQLKRDAPLAALLARLADHLADSLTAAPDDARATLNQILDPPAPGDWLTEHRGELAELCLFANDAEEARAQDLTDEASNLEQTVNARARRLLDLLPPPHSVRSIPDAPR